jgi:hypothetical protein
MKKVLRIKNSEFLLNIFPDRIETTTHINNAMDISVLDFATIDKILHSLYNVGYRDMKVLEVKK